MRVVLFWCLGIGLLGCPSVRAQPTLLPVDQYHIRVFTPAEGLPVADARYVAQLPDDYLYVTTSRGVVRFDGYAFRPVALPGFNSQVIESAHADRAGRLWLLTKENELAYIGADGRFHRMPRVLALRNTIRNAFFETADGVLWIRSLDGLVRIAPDSDDPYTHVTTADGLPGTAGLRVLDAPHGRRLVVTHEGMAFMESDTTHPKGLRFVPFEPAAVSPTPEGDYAVWANAQGIWLVFDDHVRRYGPPPRLDSALLATPPVRTARYEATVRGSTLNVDALELPAGRVAAFAPAASDRLQFPGGHPFCTMYRARDPLSCSVLPTGDGAYWLTYNRGDTVVRVKNGRATPIALPEALNAEIINTLTLDHEGSLWLGTNRGVVQLAPRRVAAVTEQEGLAEPFTTSVLQTRDDALWVGTWGGGLHRFDDGRLTRRYTTADGLPYDKIRSLYEARDGTLWIGTRTGAAVLRDNQITTRLPGIAEVRGFAETEDGTVWIGAATRLIARMPAGRMVEPDPAFWSDKQIWALHAARDGSVWIGSENGLFRYDGDRLHTYDASDGLRSPFVVAIHEEDDGTLWFSTYENGLHRYRDGRFVAVTTREGLHHNGVWRMMRDEHGGVWMSSDQGIFRVQHDRLHAVADAVERGTVPAVRLDPLVFTEVEGLPSRECNRASPAGWRLRDGRLAFNNLRGFVLIDPARALDPLPPPQTTLQRVEADGVPVDLRPGRTAHVPTGTKQLRVDFAALSFIAPGQNHYRYRLDGYDEGWIDGGHRPSASYTNLPPNDYTFRVQSASGTSAWGPATTAVLTLRPRLWQTWWVRILALGAIFGLLAAAYQYRVRRLLEMERLRLRLAADLHDDVGSNISSIALISEMLKNRAPDQDLDPRHLQRIHAAAEETVRSLRDIIWLVDPKHDTLDDLVRRMRRVAPTLLNGTRSTFDVPASTETHPLDMAFMRNVFLIYKEALHNIAKHAEAQHVTIAVETKQGRLTLHIRDDGRGFDASSKRGHGLANMRRRAETINGHLAIESQPGDGTQVTLSAKMA